MCVCVCACVRKCLCADILHLAPKSDPISLTWLQREACVPFSMYMCIFVRVHLRTCVCVYVCMCVCRFVCMYLCLYVCVCVREKEIESAREKEIESAREKERKSDCERAGQGRERQFVFQSKSTRCASQSTQVCEYICMYEYACLCGFECASTRASRRGAHSQGIRTCM